MTQNGLELNFLRQFLGSFLDHFGFIYGHYFVNISPLFDPCLAIFSSLLGHFKKFFLAGIKCFRLDLIYFRLELIFLWLELIANFSKKVGHFFRREGAADPR